MLDMHDDDADSGNASPFTVCMCLFAFVVMPPFVVGSILRQGQADGLSRAASVQYDIDAGSKWKGASCTIIGTQSKIRDASKLPRDSWAEAIVKVTPDDGSKFTELIPLKYQQIYNTTWMSKFPSWAHVNHRRGFNDENDKKRGWRDPSRAKHWEAKMSDLIGTDVPCYYDPTDWRSVSYKNFGRKQEAELVRDGTLTMTISGCFVAVCVGLPLLGWLCKYRRGSKASTSGKARDGVEKRAKPRYVNGVEMI